MNYLGHAVLSLKDPEILTGNMIGDHVKGKLILDTFPENITRGIMLHRKIDSFTDSHPASQRAKLLFRPDFGLYSGAITDTLYDHFLANDPKHFPSDKDLKDFSLETYSLLDSQSAHFPETFRSYFPYMKEHNWLYNYRTLKGIERSLQGLSRRAKYIPDIAPAYAIFIGHYYQLAQCYYELMDDVLNFVKVELSH